MACAGLSIDREALCRPSFGGFLVSKSIVGGLAGAVGRYATAQRNWLYGVEASHVGLGEPSNVAAERDAEQVESGADASRLVVLSEASAWTRSPCCTASVLCRCRWRLRLRTPPPSLPTHRRPSATCHAAVGPRQSGKCHTFPNRRPGRQCTRPSPAAPAPGRPGGLQPDGMDARLAGGRQAGTRRRHGPSVAVRGKPAVTASVPQARTPSAHLPAPEPMRRDRGDLVSATCLTPGQIPREPADRQSL
jgi:hypothetical protein